MMTQRIIIFYPNEREEQRYPLLYERAHITNFTFEHVLQKEDLHAEHLLVIIWDSSKNGKGITKLEEIKHHFPHLLLFLVAEHPSPEYLMAAIKWRVSSFFKLPVDVKEFQQAISQVFTGGSAPYSLVQTVKNWFGKFQLYTQALAKTVSESSLKNKQSRGRAVLGIVPTPFLPFLNKKSEQENLYDISVHFFGNLHIKIREKTVSEIKGKKNATVLAYLLFNHHKPVHKDILMEKFWSDVTPSSARNSLNVAIYSIRKTLSATFNDQEIILYDNESYCINPDLEIITDIEKYTNYWKKGRSIESSQGLENALGAYNKAVAMYKDDFLANIRFEEWCESERDNLKEIYLFILNRLSVYFFQQKNYDACINICRKMLDKDDCLEDVHRKLMSCYNLLGLNDLALKQYYKCEKVLEKELNLEPSEITKETFKKIKSGKLI